METILYWSEKIILLLGIIFVLTAMTQYGKRSHDWKGVVTMFYKRVAMTAEEYRWYRLGVGLVILAIILRIAVLTFWSSY